MDGHGSRERPSAVPRLSRLPVARPTSAAPKAAPGDGGGAELQPRKLRHASSRPQLSPGCATPADARPRPSLSQRTVETLSQLPSSPAMTKRPSSFFDQPGPPPGVPSFNPHGASRGSSAQGSRPGSSAGYDDRTAAAASLRAPGSALNSSLAAPAATTAGTPRRRSHFAHAATPRSAAAPAMPRRASTTSPSKPPGAAGTAGTCSGSARSGTHASCPPQPPTAKTVAARPAAPRAHVDALFRKPSLPAMRQTSDKPNPPRRPVPQANQPPAATWDGAIPSIPPTKPGPGKTGSAASLRSTRSSAALREQIAKAKAATRAAAKQDRAVTPNDGASSVAPPAAAFDFDADHHDPFNQRRAEDPNTRALQLRVATARSSGWLNISALGLKAMPAQVLNMYDLESIGAHDGSWAESVDLRRLIAADNELETLDDAVFPDLGLDALAEEEDGPGNIFLGLETLDLHGNVLTGVPLGFRRLLHLTSLNLSSNQLENACLDVISQMPALKALGLSKNRLSGPLDPGLCNLRSLETLDVHGNSISALPANVEHLSCLRILNLSENIVSSLPFDSLAKLPLTELLLRRNKLSGALIRAPACSLPLLQTLDASSNQLTHLVTPGAAVGLPRVNAVSLSMNRLQELPDMTTWANLVTLTVDENSISSIPESFTGLGKLRHADFSNNDLVVVPPEIARMGGLATMRLMGNPLRDRRFATASTDELKEILAARLEPPPPYQEPSDGHVITGLMGRLVEADSKLKATGGPSEAEAGDWDSRSDADDDFATPPTSAPHSPVRSPSAANGARSRPETRAAETWPVKSGGLLDRARTASTALDGAACLEVAARHQVRQAQLHHNLLTCIPGAVRAFGATLVSLSLAHNQLAGDAYLAEGLELAALTEINLASNAITDLAPLTRFLRAPALDKIDVSRNRIRCLPGSLMVAFPRLTVLLASNNKLEELEPESIRGLKTVDASSNEIAHLDPRIGLLGGPGGLQRLEVSGNRFRVPRWTILERGTEATLRWLRGRVPEDEMAAWRERAGESGEELD